MNMKSVVSSVSLLCLLSIGLGVDSKADVDLPETYLNKGDSVQYEDCDSVRIAGYKQSGLYLVWYNATISYKVVCNHTEAGSYTVIQQRLNGAYDFQRTWHEYQVGFGYAEGDYWAGLNSIYYLTSTGNNVLTVNMMDYNGNYRFIRYNYFKVGDASDGYRLSIWNAYGNVPDDLGFNNNVKFATYDNPDVDSCAVNLRAGWWYNYCTHALPNGKYYQPGHYTPSGGFYDGIYWASWHGYAYSLTYISMSLSKN